MRHGSRTVARLAISMLIAFLGPQLLVAPAAADHGYWEFKKSTNKDSTLKWNLTGQYHNNVTASESWRAGSGISTDVCATDEGWLPNGWYDAWGMLNKKDGVIKGRAIHIQDKVCHDGTIRTELFIHTEETMENDQYCPTSGDDPYCWETVDDYLSEGCIKVAYPGGAFNDAIGDVHFYFHNRAGGSSQHGTFTINTFLHVIAP